MPLHNNPTPLSENLSELSIFAHNLKDPLSYAIVSLNSLMVLAEELNFETQESKSNFDAILSIVKNNIYKAIRISNNILDTQAFTRNDSKIFIKPCNITELLQNNLLIIKEVLRLKHANATFITNVSEPFYACVDEFALERVLLNLLTNSINHLPIKGGIISIILRVETNTFCIEVKDNGSGIDEETMPYIFDEFYKKATGTVNGAGLGLFIAKSLINLHNGSISAQSVPFTETTFTVTLPLETNEVHVVTLNSEIDVPFEVKFDNLTQHELSTLE